MLGAAYIASRVWEIVDIVMPSQRLRKEGEVVGLQPVVALRPDAVSFGMGFRC